jgi:hypothetical protein
LRSFGLKKVDHESALPPDMNSLKRRQIFKSPLKREREKRRKSLLELQETDEKKPPT